MNSTGNRNTGDRNTGNRNTGDRSTGDRSTGNFSTGDRSTGNFSTGDFSTGDWSVSNYSTGHFSTVDYSGFGAFNKPCDKATWDTANKPNFLYFNLTKWVESGDMTDKEKEENSNWETTCGYLRVYDYKEAFQNSYKKASKEEKEQLLKLPNFDADVFFEISGIDVRKPDNSDKIEELKEKVREIQKQIEELEK